MSSHALPIMGMLGWKVGHTVDIPGAPSNPYRLTAHVYDYEKDRVRCVACEGSGMPWKSWMMCEHCPAIIYLTTEQVFLPATRTVYSASPLHFGPAKKDPYEGCGWAPIYLPGEAHEQAR